LEMAESDKKSEVAVPENLEEELEQLIKPIVSSEVIVNANHLLRLHLRRTKWREMKIKVSIPDAYPSIPCQIEFQSDSLSPELMQNFQKKTKKKAKKLAKAEKLHILNLVGPFVQMMDENRLLVCYEEISDLKEFFADNSSLKISEKKGTVKIKSKVGRYETAFEFKVPDFYPADPVEFRLVKSTFPERYKEMFTRTGDVMRKKLALGHDEDYVFRRVGKDEGKRLKEITAPEIKQFDIAEVHSLRDDLRLLSHISDLRTRQDDKKARRELKDIHRFGMKNVKRELDALNAEQRRLKELEETRDPNRSLAAMCKYLVHRCFQELIEARCMCCGKRVIPKDPAKLHAMEDNEEYHDTKKYPQRANCGHWFHHECLHKFITTPPFAKPCPKCKVQVTHPMWSDDSKTLEHAWAQKQAYDRELDDVGDFLGDIL